MVKATYLVPDPDGTMRREARRSTVDLEAFLAEVHNDTK